jgi:hypothetical protein
MIEKRKWIISFQGIEKINEVFIGGDNLASFPAGFYKTIAKLFVDADDFFVMETMAETIYSKSNRG